VAGCRAVSLGIARSLAVNRRNVDKASKPPQSPPESFSVSILFINH